MTDQLGQFPGTPDFADFYRAVNQREPFPWQARLALQVSEQNMWPAEIGVPTGLGKTACLDIAVWWLASQAHLEPHKRSAPTRIWWVVNRRLLVDEASKHAQRIREMLGEPDRAERPRRDRDVLRRVGARLASLGIPPVGDPLCVIPMRGGLTLQRPPNPARPSVIVSTIPMYGSRLLFRGFGSSCAMRPIDAALAGTDSLVLVDEAHLARHLRELMPKLQQCIAESAPLLLPKRRSAPQVVSLTATGDTPPEERFELDEDDRANGVIRLRLAASKPVEVDAAPRGDTAKALRDAAVRLLSEAAAPAACVIFCNTPAVGRSVYDLISSDELGAQADVMLATGRIRQADADRLRDQLLAPATGAPADIGSEQDRPQRQRHLIVVATQTLEVGADLDFEYMVTEQCGVRALTQRLGRLNRLGLHGHARAVYVHRPPPRRSRPSTGGSGSGSDDSSGNDGGWPVYGKEPDAVFERLDSFDEQVDLSPGLIAERLGEPGDDPGRAPEILPGLLWEWIKTTTPPHGEAPVEPYFSGISEPKRSASVIWRAYVPSTEFTLDRPDSEIDELDDPAEPPQLWPRVGHDETVEVPVYELREALRARNIDRVTRASDTNGIESAQLRDVRPGDLVILPSDMGMYDEFGWAPDSTEAVTDLSIERSGLPLDVEALERLLQQPNSLDTHILFDALGEVLHRVEDESDDFLKREAAEHLIELLRDHPAAGSTPGDWQAFLDELDATPASPSNGVPRLEVRAGERSARIDESDEVSLCRSLPPEAMELKAHGDAVGEHAADLAKALGLSQPLTDVVRTSGQFHDVGKADRRFQRWLNPDATATESSYVPLAKSDMALSRWPTARRDAGWPRGGRHEELSARLVSSWLAEGTHELDPEDQALLVHLVVSHHGKGRPLVVPVDDGGGERVSWEFPDGTNVSACADLSQTDWDQPGRFRRLNDRFGPWGLALLEAIVRQADHEVSANGTSASSSSADEENEVR